MTLQQFKCEGKGWLRRGICCIASTVRRRCSMTSLIWLVDMSFPLNGAMLALYVTTTCTGPFDTLFW